jgi:hypothetical protein
MVKAANQLPESESAGGQETGSLCSFPGGSLSLLISRVTCAPGSPGDWVLFPTERRREGIETRRDGIAGSVLCSWFGFLWDFWHCLWLVCWE